MKRRPELLRSFEHPGFGLLWTSIAFNGYGMHISTVAITWLALEFSESPLGVGVALAIRVLPRLVFAVPVGTLSDRVDRRQMIVVTNLLGGVVGLAAAFASYQGWFGYAGVIVVAVLVGILDVAESTLSKPYVFDVVGPEDAVNGMALEQMANKVFGVLGGITTGLLLAAWGGVGAFGAMGLCFGLSGLAVAAIPYVAPDAGRHRVRAIETVDEGEAPPSRSTLLELLRSPAVLVFAAIAMAAEVFAYSHEVLAPSFARDILDAGEQGLGNLVAARNAGGVMGLVLLGSVARKIDPEKLLPAVCVGFGAALVVFSYSESYLLSLGLMGLVGVAWAAVDALLPTVLQQNVPDDERGAAVGIWNLGRGFGPLGELEIGALAALIGVAATQALNGAVFAIIVVAMMSFYRRHQSAAQA